jgi:solute carrier family 35 protein F1/2
MLHIESFAHAGVWRLMPVLVQVIAIGQFISLLLCSTGVFAKLLVLRGVNLPTTTSLVNYVLLAVVYVPVLLHRGVFFSALRSHWLFFVLVALVDVEANFVIIKAYQYTSFTSVQLLDCTAIVWVLLLSRVVLKTQHTWLHYLGVVVALVGTAGIIASDAIQAEQESGDQSAGSNPVLGDVLVLVAAVLYACSNVGEEYTVRVLTKTHFLGLVGLFGTLICGVQAAALELDDLKKVEWTMDVVFLLVGFVISLFAM